MKMSGLLSRRNPELTGVAGTARVPRKGDVLPRRMSDKDIVFVSLDELSADDATTIVDSSPAYVVNVAKSAARTPRAAYRILASAGVPVLSGVTADDVVRLKDGDKVRIDEGTLWHGAHELA